MSATHALTEYKKLFDEHIGKLRHFVYYKVGNEELANDLVQDAFLKIWEIREKVKWESAPGLLYTMANNLAMNHFNREKVALNFRASMGATVNKQDPSYLMEEEEFHQKLQGCLGQLPEHTRETFLLNRIDKMKYAQIAETLEVGVKAIEKRMSVAIKLLTQCVGFKV